MVCLQTLNLERNGIGDDGAKSIADGLKHCSSLQTLNLEWKLMVQSLSLMV